MATNNIVAAIKQICDEKNLSMEAVIGAIEAALAAAYRKEFGEPNQNIKVVFNADNGQAAVFDVKTVVEDVDLEAQEKALEEMRLRKEAGEEIPEEEQIKKFNSRSEIMLSEAVKVNPDYKIGDVIETKLPVPEEYGRMAAQTAKQVIVQRLREAERDHIFDEYKDKEKQLVLGTIQQRAGRRFIVDLGQANGILPPEEQIRNEGYNIGTRLNFFITEVRMGTKGPEIILSRTHPEIVRELFTMEVPEIAAGTVEIKAIAREAGSRTKIAVAANDDNIDPVGSCVGQKGARVQTVISELGGEKIDIIEWNADEKAFIANSLSPAAISEIRMKPEEKIAQVIVEDDQLSLAIGRSGQNARLAAKLTGWKIDILPKNVPQPAETAAPEEIKDESKEENKEEVANEAAEQTEEVVEEKKEKVEKPKVKKSKKPSKK
ncbi:MAG: transcription termination/antitermination protein NusA [Parcubacteria group bacterium]|nr:MAG: transcription termination/antitermination protein NusA [Parcubacteria group bacterium]